MRSLPRIVSNLPGDLRNFLDRVREYLSADGEEKFVTLGELRRGGVISTTPGGMIIPPINYIIDPPTQPKNVTATGGLACIFVEWGEPDYRGHMHAEVWSAPTNDFTTKTLLGTAPGTLYVDNLGGGGSRYYWVRFVNLNDAVGPFSDIAGALGTAAADPAYLLDVLAGSITDAELSTALNDQIDTNTTQITNVRNLYTVKMDNAGYLSGFGLMSTLSEGGAATSDFFVNADRFAVTTPTSSIPARANTTAYAVGAFVSVPSSTSKMLVAKVAGTSGGSAPNIASTAIGALVTDGTVTWQVASRVPLSVLTTSATINGVTVTPGVYIDGAAIVNATITNAAIGDAAITNAKINDLAASKITTGSIAVGQDIQSTGFSSGSSGWRIRGNGDAEFQNAIIRGTLYATAGTIGGAVISANNVQSSNYVAGSAGWLLSNDDGLLRVGGQILVGSATGYLLGTGMFAGYSGTAFKFHLGNPSGAHIYWDGSVLKFSSGATDVIATPNVTDAAINDVDFSQQSGSTNITRGAAATTITSITFTTPVAMNADRGIFCNASLDFISNGGNAEPSITIRLITNFAFSIYNVGDPVRNVTTVNHYNTSGNTSSAALIGMLYTAQNGTVLPAGSYTLQLRVTNTNGTNSSIDVSNGSLSMQTVKK